MSLWSPPERGERHKRKATALNRARLTSCALGGRAPKSRIWLRRPALARDSQDSRRAIGGCHVQSSVPARFGMPSVPQTAKGCARPIWRTGLYGHRRGRRGARSGCPACGPTPCARCRWRRSCAPLQCTRPPWRPAWRRAAGARARHPLVALDIAAKVGIPAVFPGVLLALSSGRRRCARPPATGRTPRRCAPGPRATRNRPGWRREARQCRR